MEQPSRHHGKEINVTVNHEQSASTVTATEVARVAREGAWTADGTIRPEAVKLSEAFVAALTARSGDGLLPSHLSELVKQVLTLATPGFPRIEVSGGFKLSAHTLKLTAEGAHPLVIVPAGWNPVGWPFFEYAYIVLALRGYHVLAYTPRGLGLTRRLPDGSYDDGPFTSEGTIDVGGPIDRADGSSVITYALNYFAPSKIAFLGESYGSGISQLVAAHDERVDAVVALSTWGNLATSLYENGTRHLAAVKALVELTGGPLERKFDEENLKVLQDFLENRNKKKFLEWGAERAPESYVKKTNARGVPTFFSNTWHEGLFAVNQVLETFNLLTGPKRLNMWIGDHTAPEGPGLIAPPATPGDFNIPMLEAYAWLDHHLKGVQNGVEQWPQVSNQVMFTYSTAPVLDPETGQPTGTNEIVTPALRETRAAWDEVTTSVQRLGLTAESVRGSDGKLIEGTETGWNRSFIVGVDPEVTAMDKIVATGQAEWSGNPKTYSMDRIDRNHAIAWATAPLSAPAGEPACRIRGIPALSLTVRSTAASTTLVAYLFDVDENNFARIITHEPITLEDLTPGTDVPAVWRLQAAAYNVPANHRLMLVIDSKDPLYGDASIPGTQITISSPVHAPSCLDLPIG
ncbi:alpha/beta fold hydrolase [Sorangium sp. So ce1099]|uniref:alpha/beta fold hydrolase n=1 Tax=Sorangium sp. So ce1099 TaxID=3133331 RepID=UPI003F620F3F